MFAFQMDWHFAPGSSLHLSASHIDASNFQDDDYNERNVRDTVKLFDSLVFIVHPKISSFVANIE